MSCHHPCRKQRAAVYGTLLQGERNHDILASSNIIGYARVKGYIMYSRDDRYPYIVEGPGSIHVEIYEVSANVLENMDDLEGAPELYARKNIELDGHHTWLYIWAGERIEGDQRIPSGDWKMHQGKISPGGSPVVSCAVIETLLGAVEARFLGDVVTNLMFFEESADREKEKMNRRTCLKTNMGTLTEEAFNLLEKELNEYFSGGRATFSIPLYLRGTSFQKRVWNALLEIPYGDVMTYGELAKVLGIPNGARAVGGAVGRNPVPILVPCHRIVAFNGLGGFSCGVWRKKKILALERRGITEA